MVSLQHFLVLAAVLFFIGLSGVVTRRHPLHLLIGLELMLGAGALNLVAFWRFNPITDSFSGPLLAFFALVIAVAQAGIGGELIVALRRGNGTTDVEKLDELRETVAIASENPPAPNKELPAKT